MIYFPDSSMDGEELSDLLARGCTKTLIDLSNACGCEHEIFTLIFDLTASEYPGPYHGGLSASGNPYMEVP